jgi:glycosyltransferase involved in cell wall biosynthesis
MTSSTSSTPSPADPLRVAFLVEELGRSGGMAVVRRYARHLGATIVVCGAKPAPLPADDDGIPVTTPAELGAVDAAVATWWTTVERLFELDAGRLVVFVQNLEHRFYRERERVDRLGALGVLDLPVDFIVIASHMRDLLARLRPDARVKLVRNGIDKRVFAPRHGVPDGPLRVLVEGQPTLWFKGIAEAVAAVRAVREPATLTLAVHDPADARQAGLDADRVEGGLSPNGMAALYAGHHVLLKLSRFEGLPLPPLEAMHVGLPCVLTPFTGSEDFARHGENALVVGFDDVPGTKAALDLLARDTELRERLSHGALRTAAAWPDQVAAADAFGEAVRELWAEPPPDPAAAHLRLARGHRLALELAREQHRRDDVALWRYARLEVRLNELLSRRSYRMAHFAKRMLRLGRGS